MVAFIVLWKINQIYKKLLHLTNFFTGKKCHNIYILKSITQNQRFTMIQNIIKVKAFLSLRPLHRNTLECFYTQVHNIWWIVWWTKIPLFTSLCNGKHEAHLDRFDQDREKFDLHCQWVAQLPISKQKDVFGGIAICSGVWNWIKLDLFKKWSWINLDIPIYSVLDLSHMVCKIVFLPLHYMITKSLKFQSFKIKCHVLKE